MDVTEACLLGGFQRVQGAHEVDEGSRMEPCGAEHGSGGSEEKIRVGVNDNNAGGHTLVPCHGGVAAVRWVAGYRPPVQSHNTNW